MTVVFIHYEFLFRMSIVMPALKIKHRLGVAFVVCGALVAHAIEVWVFAFAYYFMNASNSQASLEGAFDGSMADCVYFSFTIYTTLGFGDILPVGDMRYITGIESLTGLVLITWSASFIFIEMQKYWETSK
jgi:hypothetical protein